MVWATELRAGYLLALTDGYRTFRVAGPIAHDDPQQDDQVTANRLYRLGKSLHLTAEQRAAGPVPDPLHVWVARLRESKLAEHETTALVAVRDTDPSYRVVIIGAGLPAGYSYLRGDWSRWISRSGMARKKLHRDADAWRRGCRLLIQAMRDRYEQTSRAPSSTLTDHGLDFAYCGDPRDSLDLRSQGLIQQ